MSIQRITFFFHIYLILQRSYLIQSPGKKKKKVTSWYKSGLAVSKRLVWIFKVTM